MLTARSNPVIAMAADTVVSAENIVQCIIPPITS
jgi:acyl CoA:acetate/3-ketoacid CoA transferase alpha subunit